MLQIDNITKLLEKLKKDKINICFETSLFCPIDNVKTALKFADLLYIDIKSYDKTFLTKTLKTNPNQYKENLNYVLAYGLPIILRIPLITGYTDNKENIKSILSQLKKASLTNVKKIELLQGHNLGKEKFNKAFGSLNDFYKAPSSTLPDTEINNLIKEFRKTTNNKIEIEYLRL